MFPASSSDDEHDILQHPAAQCRDRSPNEALEKADASHAKHEPEARGNASAQPRQGIQRPRPLPPLPPQRWESRDAILHASVAESSQRESFKDLLRTIQKQENIEARLFCWERLYDETPVYCSQAYAGGHRRAFLCSRGRKDNGKQTAMGHVSVLEGRVPRGPPPVSPCAWHPDESIGADGKSAGPDSAQSHRGNYVLEHRGGQYAQGLQKAH